MIEGCDETTGLGELFAVADRFDCYLTPEEIEARDREWAELLADIAPLLTEE